MSLHRIVDIIFNINIEALNSVVYFLLKIFSYNTIMCSISFYFVIIVPLQCYRSITMDKALK